QTYLNPLPDLPFYWLNGILPGRALAFLLGALQGINFGLLYALARRVLRGGAAAPYAAAFVVTYFVFRRGNPGALIQAAACACGAAVGTLSIGGYWMAHLWAATGDPLFPFFGGLFPRGELAGAPSRDNRFLPQSLAEWLLYPLVVTFI